MDLPSYFVDFLSAIRPTDSQKEDYKTGHKTLRDRLNNDETLRSILVSDFLQGSYRRATAIRPVGEKRADVDVIVVTNLSEKEKPADAMDRFVSFLNKHYPKKWHFQDRSIAIELSYVDLDFVITSAPCEADTEAVRSAAVKTFDTPEDVKDWRLVKSWIPIEYRNNSLAQNIALSEAAKESEWKISPLMIPDRERKVWEPTHPLEQIRWTWSKNNSCNGHYVNVVKAIKWSHRFMRNDTKYPKGYPLEHIIGVCCPDSITSVAEGVTRTFADIVQRFDAHVAAGKTPVLQDHGVPTHNVLKRLSTEDFKKFHQYCVEAAEIAKRASDAITVYESANAWRELFGEEFPEPSSDDRGSGGFSKRDSVSKVSGGRFA
jgi:hypothetical protein